VRDDRRSFQDGSNERASRNSVVWRNTGGTRPGCTGLLLDGGAVLPGFVMPLSELFVKDEP
jgi:hypothetical protein